MCNAKPQCFHVSGKNFTGDEEFPGNIYLKPEESPEFRGFCIGNNAMSPYDLYKILSGFSFFIRKFSNLSIVNIQFPYSQTFKMLFVIAYSYQKSEMQPTPDYCY